MQRNYILSASLVIFLLVGGLSSPSTSVPTAGAASFKEEFVVLFDEAHGQWYNTSRMQTVLTLVNASKGSFVYVNKAPFNATNLAGADALIITNPGNESTFTRDEAFYLRQYIKRGGGLFILSNPYNVNETLSGRPDPLNQLLTLIDDADLPLEALEYWEGTNQTADIIMDDYHNLNGTRSLLDLSEDTFTNITDIPTQPKNISRVLVHTQSLSAPVRIGEAYLESYTEDIEHEAHLAEEIPLWLGGTNQSEARVVICGSTIMFSDLQISGTNLTWASYPLFNNAQLFNNTVNWVANITITPVEQHVISEPIESPLPIFVVGGTLLLAIGVIFRFKTPTKKEERTITEAIRDIRPREKKMKKRR